MPFTPPCCPYPICRASTPSPAYACRLAGSYRRRCDGRLVRRFRCRACRRTFSVQTFRLDYRLRRPDLDAAVYEALVSKVSHRQTARVLGTRRPTVERRLVRYGQHARRFHQVLLAGRTIAGSFALDEAESFETDRRLRPLTLPVLIERDSRFFVHLGAATLPARKATSEALRRRKHELEAAHGRRRNRSRAAVQRCFAVLKQHLAPKARIELVTDRKSSYPAVLRQVFGERGVRHTRTSSKARRDTRNPLFAVNHTLAMLRDGVSRLVRRTWGHAKRRARLVLHLWAYAAWRNYVRGVSNKRRDETPAMAVGIDDEPWTLGALMRWQARFALCLRGH